jgi:hypothetical protein
MNDRKAKEIQTKRNTSGLYAGALLIGGLLGVVMVFVGQLVSWFSRLNEWDKKRAQARIIKRFEAKKAGRQNRG